MKRNKIVFSVLMLSMGLSLLSCVSNKTKDNNEENKNANYDMV